MPVSVWNASTIAWHQSSWGVHRTVSDSGVSAGALSAGPSLAAAPPPVEADGEPAPPLAHAASSAVIPTSEPMKPLDRNIPNPPRYVAANCSGGTVAHAIGGAAR